MNWTRFKESKAPWEWHKALGKNGTERKRKFRWRTMKRLGARYSEEDTVNLHRKWFNMKGCLCYKINLILKEEPHPSESLDGTSDVCSTGTPVLISCGSASNCHKPFLTLPNMPVLYPPYSRHGPNVYTDRGNIPAWFRTPELTLSNPTHIWVFIFI